MMRDVDKMLKLGSRYTQPLLEIKSAFADG